MKRHIINVVIILILAFILTGCNSVEKQNKEMHIKENNTEKITGENLINNSETIVNEDIKQEFKSFTFKLMGKEFDLTNHSKVKDLFDLGFNFYYKEAIVNTIEVNGTSFFELMNTESEVLISVMMCNTSNNIVTYENAEIYGIKVDYYKSDDSVYKTPEFSMDSYNVISLGKTTLSEFDEIFKDDSDITAYDATGYSTRIYEYKNNYNKNRIELTFSDGILTSIFIRYM